MIIRLLGGLGGAFANAVNGTPRVRYDYFEVTDPDIALRMQDWDKRNTEARAAIDDFVKNLYRRMPFGPYGMPYYKLDEDGHIAAMSYNGVVPEGWGMDPEEDPQKATYLMVPLAGSAVKEVRAMPAVPAFEELAALINWPVFDASTVPSKLEREVHRINRMPCVETSSDGRVFVKLPHPANFRRCPEIQGALYDWSANYFPDCLRHYGSSVQSPAFSISR